MEPREEENVVWEALEHHYIEKGNDWYWALGIITLAAAVIAVVLGNLLFAMVIFLGGCVVGIVSSRVPDVILHAVTPRGMYIGDDFFPYNTLRSYYIDEEDPRGPHLLIKTKKTFTPLFVIPIPEDAVDDIDFVLEERLPTEHLEESFSHKMLEFFGF